MDFSNFVSFGYLGIFLATFLSSTILPISALWFVLLMRYLGYDVWLLIVFATAGNYVGALTNYYLGKLGNKFVLSRYIKVDYHKIEIAKDLFKRWGSSLLLFSWLPILGDSVIIVSGVVDIKLLWFSILILVGNFFRYIIIMFIIYSSFVK